MMSMLPWLIALGLLVTVVLLWTQGNPKMESFRDDAKKFREQFNKLGLPDIATVFDDITDFREDKIIECMRDLFGRFDDDYLLEHLALPLVQTMLVKLLRDESCRVRIEQKLLGSGFAIMDAPKPTTRLTSAQERVARGSLEVMLDTFQNNPQITVHDVISQMSKARDARSSPDEPE